MATRTVNARYRHPCRTAAQWSSSNPVLLAGEVGYESDTGKSKVGDGVKTWNELEYTGMNKVDKVDGKGLSTEDYTTVEKAKLAGIAAGANNYTHPSTHPASMITGLPTSLPANGGTANKVANKLTAGSKTYDGSAAVTITAADLGAITSIPVEYVTETEYATASKGGVVKSSTAADKVSVGTDGTMSLNTVSGSKVSGAVASATSATTATKLSTSAGSATQPVYFSSGKPVATTYTLGASVPSDAVFTDASVAQGFSASGNYRSLLLASNYVAEGGTDKTAETGQAYKTAAIYAQPSSGSLYATRFIGALNGNATSATTATQLSTSAGSATQPVYFSNGKPVATTYTLGASVPSGAKFTDTIYTLPTASSTTLGGVKTTSTVTSASGLTACPIISGVPYYKDTNTTYTLSSFGLTATAAELNYVDGVTSNIQTQLNGKASTSHTHKAVYTATLTAAGWSASAPYTQTVTVSGLLAADEPFIRPVLSTTTATAIAQKEAAGCVDVITAAANSITAKCLTDKPTADIPIRIVVIR